LRFVAALRDIADHPAADVTQKEAQLKRIADMLEGTAAEGSDGGAAAAAALKQLMSARGIEPQHAWHILQAAGQDLTKTRYRDWPELLAWCRFAAAPAGMLALRLAGGDESGSRAAQSLAIALQLLWCAENAQRHYRWLGRVYLPERWFRDAGAAAKDLGDERTGAALKQVMTAAIAQAEALIIEARGLPAAFPRGRPRMAAAALLFEAHAWARSLARRDSLARPWQPGRLTRSRAVITALFRGGLFG
jgi:phytoene/squalene synthetase